MRSGTSQIGGGGAAAKVYVDKGPVDDVVQPETIVKKMGSDVKMKDDRRLPNKESSAKIHVYDPEPPPQSSEPPQKPQPETDATVEPDETTKKKKKDEEPPKELAELPAELSVYFSCIDDVRNFMKESAANRQNKPPPPTRPAPSITDLPPPTAAKHLGPLRVASGRMLGDDHNPTIKLGSQLSFRGLEPVEAFEQLVDRKLPTPTKLSAPSAASFAPAAATSSSSLAPNDDAPVEQPPVDDDDTPAPPEEEESPPVVETDPAVEESKEPVRTHFAPLPDLPSMATGNSNADVGSIHNFLDELEEALSFQTGSPQKDMDSKSDTSRRLSNLYEETPDIVDDDDNASYTSQMRRRASAFRDADGESEAGDDLVSANGSGRSHPGDNGGKTPVRTVWGSQARFDPPIED